MRGFRFCLSFCFYGDPPKRPKVLSANFQQLENGMASCTLTFSPPTVPDQASPVTQRTLFITDGQGASFSVIFDGDVVQTGEDEIPDLNVSHENPGSCYLVDNNAGGADEGNSPPSQPFTLDPGEPTPNNEPPLQPTILGVQWASEPLAFGGNDGRDRVLDNRRNKR